MKVINVDQNTPEWLRCRLGKITGTRLKAIMGTKAARHTLLCELLAEEITGEFEEIYVSEAMKWGTVHEEPAIHVYEQVTGEKTDIVGFVQNDDIPLVGLSPDRLIKKRGKYVKGVEVKCPSSKVAVKYRLADEIPPEYKWQVVHYFLVCDTLKELDFVVYDPRIKEDRLKIWVKNVTREELQGDIDEALEKLSGFIDELFIHKEELYT